MTCWEGARLCKCNMCKCVIVRVRPPCYVITSDVYFSHLLLPFDGCPTVIWWSYQLCWPNSKVSSMCAVCTSSYANIRHCSSLPTFFLVWCDILYLVIVCRTFPFVALRNVVAPTTDVKAMLAATSTAENDVWKEFKCYFFCRCL